MQKKLLMLIIFAVLAFSITASASDVEVWHDDSLKISEMKKIFIMPIESELNAGSQLMPAKQLKNQLHGWSVDGVNSAVKKGKLTVKNLDALLEDMKFIYSDNISSGDVFFKRAYEMGYKAFIRVKVTQKFDVEHVPETTRTYTEYKEIERRDSHGKLIETLRIPEEKTEVIPALDVTYLHTVCEPRIYFTSDPYGDYVGAVNYGIYREYQGGPVIKVVENILKASMKILITGKK